MANLRIPLDYKEKNLPRAAWNLSQPVITTLMQCLNVPMKFETLKPKDDVDVNYDYIMQSMPMVGQLLNDWKLRIFTFKSSLSNYYGWMDNNTRQDSSAWKNKQHHYISPLHVDVDTSAADSILSAFFPNLDRTAPTVSSVMQSYLSVVPSFANSLHYQGLTQPIENPLSASYNAGRRYFVQPGSLLDMIGLPVSYISPRGIAFSGTYGYFEPTYNDNDCFNADYILCYLDSVRNYLVNNQYETVPYLVSVPKLESIDVAPFVVYGDGFNPLLLTLSLSSIDKFLMDLRMQSNGIDLLKLALSTENIDIALWLCSLRFGGLFCSQYERDMLTSLMYSGSQSEVLINVDDDGNFSINQLRFANRYQLLQDRADVAGGRYRDRLRTIWGSEDSSKLDIPQLVGVNSYRVSPRGVISTADTYNSDTDTGSSTGQLNGVVNTDSHSKYKHSIYSEDDSILMFMVQLVPDVVYSNGIGKGLDIHMFDDEYTPQFDQLGFQDVPLRKYNILPSYVEGTGVVALDASYNPSRVVGKNLAFIDLISNVGRVHGKFSADEYFETWVLKRTFDRSIDVSVVDSSGNSFETTIGVPLAGVTPYANPLEYQYPFSVTSSEDPNFVFMFGLDIRAVRSKGKSYMPNLGQ